MEELIRASAAYKILSGDRAAGKLSHAYALNFPDRLCLRQALKLFAAELFGFERGSREFNLVMSESFADMKIYPAEGKKISVSDASDIISDSALKPVEGDKKVFVVTDADNASALIQNKLLKVLEEPPAGVYFFVGTVSWSPLLDTVKSRVKKLEIPPFSPREIYAALERAEKNPENRRVAERCGGRFGTAKSMLEGGWYDEVCAAANEIFSSDGYPSAGEIALKYGDFKYKNELLAELQRLYFCELESGVGGNKKVPPAACIYALESLTKAATDVRFNANFSALLYDFLLRVETEKNKWKKL